MKSRLVFLLMLLAFGLHVAMGEVDIAWDELLGALFTGGEVSELHATIVKEVRVPRAVTAIHTIREPMQEHDQAVALGAGGQHQDDVLPVARAREDLPCAEVAA